MKGSALPEVLVRTLEAKEMLRQGLARTVQEAAEKANLSRSAFYKYREAVFPLEEAARGKVVTLSMMLEHRSGTLSGVLNCIAAARGNVRTINQSLPVQGAAEVTVSFETAEMERDLESLINNLGRIPGVLSVSLVAQQ